MHNALRSRGIQLFSMNVPLYADLICSQRLDLQILLTMHILNHADQNYESTRLSLVWIKPANIGASSQITPHYKLYHYATINVMHFNSTLQAMLVNHLAPQTHSLCNSIKSAQAQFMQNSCMEHKSTKALSSSDWNVYLHHLAFRTQLQIFTKYEKTALCNIFINSTEVGWP